MRREKETYTGWVKSIPNLALYVPTKCPHGVPGDELWVKETWAISDDADLAYRADGEEPLDGDDYIWRPKWRSPLCMPRKFSRITLTITAIRVERLQDITEADARAEGFESRIIGEQDTIASSYRCPFADYWDSINNYPDKCWADNPWVWVITFERRKP